MERRNGTSIRILIVTEPEPATDWMRQSLKELNYQVAAVVESAYDALQVLAQTRLDIILADTSARGIFELEWIQRVALESPTTMVMVSAGNAEMEFVRQAMLAGAQGFLLKPFDLSDLDGSIQQVHQLSLQRKAALAEAAAAPEAAGQGASQAYAIAAFSPKGGTGATTLAVNLAIALKQQTNAPVLLVDADLRTADVDIFLSILTKHSVHSLLDMGSKIDPELLDRVAAQHASGISVLRGEPQLQFEIPIQAGQMSDLMEGLSALWEGYIVYNTSDGLDRWTLEILDGADAVLVVTTPELPALRATRNFLELADAAAEPGDKWQLIMSSYQGKKVLPIADVEASIHFPVRATIAEDVGLVSAAINRGTPLVISHPKSPVARDIAGLAKQLIEASVKARSAQAVAGRPSTQAGTGRPSEEGKRSFWHSVAGSIRLSAG